MPEIYPTPAFRVLGGQSLPSLKRITPDYSITLPSHCTHAIFRLVVCHARF